LAVIGIYFYQPLVMVAGVCLSIILLIWSLEIMKTEVSESPTFIALQAVRLVAWSVGGIQGIFTYLISSKPQY